MSIEIQSVSKSFGETRALDNVCITLEANHIYGLLGRNGAGKTTLLNCMTGRIFPAQGKILVDGAPALENDRALCRIYLMSEQAMYPEGMRVQEAIRLSGNFYPGFQTEAAVAMAGKFGLDIRKRVKNLSTGYSSIFKLVIALNVNTPYLLLDEPVLGLDANHRDLFYRLLIEKFAENPCCIVVSTHLIEEVSNLIDQVVIIDRGRVVRSESRDNLLAAGYTVSGPAGLVDTFIEGRDCVGTDTLGGLKTAYILGKVPDKFSETLPAGLEFSGMDLQKLFIQLTNS